MLSHGLHYGTGVFEGIRCYDTESRGPAIFRHSDHLERLARSAEMYYLPLPYPLEEIREATKELIRRNGLRSCYIRPLAFRGYGEMGLYAKSAPIDMIIAVVALGRLPRRGGQAAGRARQGQLLAADLAGGADPALEGLGPVPELDPRQDRVRERRLRGGDPPRRAGLRLRGLGREHLRRPRRRDRHAAARGLDPRRDQPQVGDPDRPRPRLHRDRARRRPRRALHGRGGLPHRHRGRAGPGPLGRRPRPGRARRDHARDPGPLRGRPARARRGVPRVARPGGDPTGAAPREPTPSEVEAEEVGEPSGRLGS